MRDQFGRIISGGVKVTAMSGPGIKEKKGLVPVPMEIIRKRKDERSLSVPF